MNKIVFLLMIAFAVGACSAAAERCPPLSVDTGREVHIVGILRKETHWGPPNFGELPTDSKFDIWLILFSQPVEVGSKKMLSIQIQVANQSILIEDFHGERVVAIGKLWLASSPSDLTPAVLGLSAIKKFAATDSVAACLSGE